MANLSDNVNRGCGKEREWRKCRDFSMGMRCVIPLHSAFIYSSKEEKNSCSSRKYNPIRERITSNQIYLGFTQTHFNILSITI